MHEPISLIQKWLGEEQLSGAPNPQQAVLATCTNDKIPHARVIAIREINDEGLLFFTQKNTRKVSEIKNNPSATLVFWFELKQREIIVEGVVTTLTVEENNHYWLHYPREAQIRFSAYAPTSSQVIPNKNILEAKRKQLDQEFQNKALPISPFYCGFRLKPERIVFYAYRTDELSDVFEYVLINNTWVKQICSP